MYVHALVERGDEEVVLIIPPDLALVRETVEVDLVVGGLSAEGTRIAHFLDRSHGSRGGG